MHSEIRVQKVELYKLSIALKEPFITSLGRDDHAHNVLVRIETDKGISVPATIHFFSAGRN